MTDLRVDLRYLSVSQAAKVLGVSVHTVYRAINGHELRWIDIGTGTRPRIRIAEQDLQAWMDSRASSGRVSSVA